MSKAKVRRLRKLAAAAEDGAAKVGRQCGDCDLCCEALGVKEIGKAAKAACPHMGGGCAIHARRPESCRVFFCAWRFGIGSDGERPDRAGFLVAPPNARSLTWQIFRAPGSREFDPHAWPGMVGQMQARSERKGLPFALEVHDPEVEGVSMILATEAWMAAYGDRRQLAQGATI